MAHNNRPLTKRELEIVRVFATGATGYEIAKQLCISENTVKTHSQNIYRKLHVSSRLQCVMLAMREGWIHPGGIPHGNK